SSTIKFDGPLVMNFAFQSLSSSSCSCPTTVGNATRARSRTSVLIVPKARMLLKFSPTMGVASAMPTIPQVIATAPTNSRTLMFIDTPPIDLLDLVVLRVDVLLNLPVRLQLEEFLHRPRFRICGRVWLLITSKTLKTALKQREWRGVASSKSLLKLNLGRITSTVRYGWAVGRVKMAGW